MKKIDVLKWGVKHIAENHGASFNVEDDGEHTYTIFDGSVPTLMDVRMLCEDLDISKDKLYTNSCGIDIFFGEWEVEQGDEEYIEEMAMWKRYGVKISE